MTKRKFDKLIDSISLTELMMVEFGIDETIIDEFVLGAQEATYDTHVNYLTTLVDGLMQIAENAEQYEVCTELKKIKDLIK